MNHTEFAGQVSYVLYNVADTADAVAGVNAPNTTTTSNKNAFALAVELELWNQRSDVMLSGNRLSFYISC